MKRLKSKTEGKKRSYKKLIFSLLALAVCIMAIIGLIKFGTVLFLIPIWQWITHSLVNATGINIWVARGVSALLIIPLIYIVALLFSRKKQKRRTGIVLLSIATAVICFSMFFMTKNVHFSFKTGGALDYYFITPEGEYDFSKTPGFNTEWGGEYKKVTPKVIEEYKEHLKQKEMERGVKKEPSVFKKQNYSLPDQSPKVTNLCENWTDVKTETNLLIAPENSYIEFQVEVRNGSVSLDEKSGGRKTISETLIRKAINEKSQRFRHCAYPVSGNPQVRIKVLYTEKV